MFVIVDDFILKNLLEDACFPLINREKNEYYPFIEVMKIRDTNISYIAQIETKPHFDKSDKLSNIGDVFLYDLDGSIIGRVLLEKMFPVFADEIFAYQKEYIHCQDAIEKAVSDFFVSEKAIILYMLKLEEPDDDISLRCYNYKFLEAKLIQLQINEFLRFLSVVDLCSVERKREFFVVNVDGFEEMITYKDLSKRNFYHLLCRIRTQCNINAPIEKGGAIL